MKYTVSYEEDEDGIWVASVREVRGCHTQGRTREEARSRVREALSLYVPDMSQVELVDEFTP